MTNPEPITVELSPEVLDLLDLLERYVRTYDAYHRLPPVLSLDVRRAAEQAYLLNAENFARYLSLTLDKQLVEGTSLGEALVEASQHRKASIAAADAGPAAE